MKIVGYCMLKENVNYEFAMGSREEWDGEVCPVLEFNEDTKSVLAVHPDGANMGTFDYKDIRRSFECTFINDQIIGPPNISEMEKIAYCSKITSRKEALPHLNVIKQMVIRASLHKGEFYDGFLWSGKDEIKRKYEQIKNI